MEVRVKAAYNPDSTLQAFGSFNVKIVGCEVVNQMWATNSLENLATDHIITSGTDTV